MSTFKSFHKKLLSKRQIKQKIGIRELDSFYNMDNPFTLISYEREEDLNNLFSVDIKDSFKDFNPQELNVIKIDITELNKDILTYVKNIYNGSLTLLVKVGSEKALGFFSPFNILANASLVLHLLGDSFYIKKNRFSSSKGKLNKLDDLEKLFPKRYNLLGHTHFAHDKNLLYTLAIESLIKGRENNVYIDSHDNIIDIKHNIINCFLNHRKDNLYFSKEEESFLNSIINRIHKYNGEKLEEKDSLFSLSLSLFAKSYSLDNIREANRVYFLEGYNRSSGREDSAKVTSKVAQALRENTWLEEDFLLSEVEDKGEKLMLTNSESKSLLLVNSQGWISNSLYTRVDYDRDGMEVNVLKLMTLGLFKDL